MKPSPTDVRNGATTHAPMNSTRIFMSFVLLFGGTVLAQVKPDAIKSVPDAPEGKSHMVVLGENSGIASFPSDAIYEEGDFVDGEKNGLWTRYYANGKMRSQIHYAADQPFGDYRLYGEQGELFEEGRWENSMNVGSLRRYWPNGSIQQILSFDGNGTGQGQQRYFHDNGQLEMLVELVDGQESGDLIRLDREGRVVSRTTYSTGHIVRRSH